VIGLALLAQLTVVTRVPDRAAACEPIEMAVAVTARSQSLPRLLAPTLPGFEVLRAPSAPATWPTTGQPGFRTSEFRYVLATAQTGPIVIPAFEARVDGASARSDAARMTIVPVNAASAKAVVARARVDTSLSVRLHAMTAAETVYVGQQANYEVAVFLAQGVREQLKRNPTFFPPEIPSVLAYDIPALGSRSRGSIGSECFDALVYQRAVFPIMPGRFVIPPAQLAYALPSGSGFFSREETHEAQTDSVVVIAIEPPAVGRPDGFLGAVGALRVTSRVDAAKARVGTPLVLTVRVAGTGNVRLFPRPPLNIPWAGIVRGDERVEVDTSARRVRGSKEFDWVLTPKIAGELDVPPISYSYYDPDRRRYEVVTTPSTRVNVGRGALAAEDTLQTDDIFPVRKRYRGPIGAPLSDRPLFWALLALMPFPAMGRRLWPRLGWRRASRPEVTAMPRSPATGNAARDAAATRRAFVGAIGRRIGSASQDFTRPGSLVRALRRAGVSKGVAQDAERLVRELETVAYSGLGDVRPASADDAARLLAAIDTEALPAGSIPRRYGAWPMVLLATAFGARAVVAAIPADTAAVFDRAVQAYEAREYAVARAGFAEVVAAEPRAADGWANFGTAAWMVGDTARAVEGWQRALRFEPLAADVRERVTLLQGLPMMSAGYVPPVLVSALLIVALGAWGACCFLMWRAAGRGARVAGRGPFAAGVAAAGLIAVALVMKTWQSGAHRAVVRASAALSVDPSLGADRGASTIVGEVVRVVEEQSVWTRISLDDRRQGWVETSSLIRLDR
jgi:hypothetical protein